MADPYIPDCCDAQKLPVDRLFYALYCVLLSIDENTGGGVTTDEYTSTFTNATGNGSVPLGVLGWSITAVSGTVTVQGEALPNGGTTRGGGYGGKVSSAAIPYTVVGGVALVSYDVPA